MEFFEIFLIFVMKFISKILLICGLKQTPPTSQRLNTVLMNKRLIRLQFAPKFVKTMQINSDGSVIPCSIDWQAKNNLGNIKDFSLKELWNGDTFENSD